MAGTGLLWYIRPVECEVSGSLASMKFRVHSPYRRFGLWMPDQVRYDVYQTSPRRLTVIPAQACRSEVTFAEGKKAPPEHRRT